VEEKVHAVKTALNQINVASASREAGVLESTLRYDLNKLEQTLPDVLADKPLGPKTDSRQIDRACNSGKQAKAPCACLELLNQIIRSIKMGDGSLEQRDILGANLGSDDTDGLVRHTKNSDSALAV
jgi:transposase-like protein